MSNFVKDLSKSVVTIAVVLPTILVCQGVGEMAALKLKGKLKKK